MLPGLGYLFAAFFVLVTAFSFGRRLMCPGTQWNLRLIMPHVLAIGGSAAWPALRNSLAFCNLSSFSGSFLIAICMWLRR